MSKPGWPAAFTCPAAIGDRQTFAAGGWLLLERSQPVVQHPVGPRRFATADSRRFASAANGAGGPGISAARHPGLAASGHQKHVSASGSL